MRKKLIISYRTPDQALDQFEENYNKIKDGKMLEPHFEIGFNDRDSLSKFIKNLDVIMTIKNDKPNSVYELAKIMGRDQSNLNKLIKFLERIQVIELKEEKVNNRIVKRPIVNYSKIEFNLAA